MLADVLGRPIGFPKTYEGSAFGAAIVGMRALGIVDSLDVAADLVPIGETVSPGPAADVYTRLLPLYSDLYIALEPAFDALARLGIEPPGSPTPAPTPPVPLHLPPSPAPGGASP
jgi:gluconokinase